VGLDETMAGVGEFYPGSKQRRAANPVVHEEEDLPDLGKGRTLVVNGRDVEFFGIGTLAAVLNRKAGTIRAWEADGTIPASGFIKPGQDRDPRGRRRLWTRAQIIGIWRIAKEEGVLYPGPRINIERTEFETKVRALFKQLKEG
jgi:hypothetical protein